jgi:methylglyoxal synthase
MSLRTIVMVQDKKIALVAHDNKKNDLFRMG